MTQPRPTPRDPKTVSCIECGTNVEVPQHITHDVKCEDCEREQFVERHKENAVNDNDENFTRKQSMERLKWEFRELPCALPNGEQLVKVSDTSYTVIQPAEDAPGAPEKCPECGYDRVRSSSYDNGVIMGVTVRCDCCDQTHYQRGF